MRVRKAVIPAAGLGTRFLPASKALPKEMLPIVDKPTIQYIIEEAVNSGIEDIVIISGRGKRAIEDHFDKSFELEEILAQKGKGQALEEIKEISNLANIYYIRQKEPLGLGHAIWCARSFIGDEPFAVMLGDDIVHADKPCLQQLMEVFYRFQSSIVGIQEVAKEDVSKYGVISQRGVQIEADLLRVEHLVEKPDPEVAPSNYAIMGRYILQPDIFSILEKQMPGASGEIQLTDAINTLNQSKEVFAYNFQGVRYDVGDKFGFIRATLDFALNRDDLKNEVLQYMKELMEQELITQGR